MSMGRGRCIPRILCRVVTTTRFSKAMFYVDQSLSLKSIEEINTLSGESVKLCMQCSTCTGIIIPTGRVGLWLDSPMIEEFHGPGSVRKELPAKFIQFERHGIDISKDPMLVYPTQHYHNGGTNVNGATETIVPGLYAAGEAIGGVHGENRL